MKKYGTFKLLAPFVLVLLLLQTKARACTIISGISKNGEVWNANNEDGPFGVANFINVFTKTDSNKYGYYTLSYLSPLYGSGGSIQGGMNEAGLTFDFNQIDRVAEFDAKSKASYPLGNDAILPHILGNLATVDEVITFFNTYWFEDGFRSSQMHVADSQGNFAIISASGVYRAEKGTYLISTNFDIAAGHHDASCWRYSTASEKLANADINLETMKVVLMETAQKNGATMYSNIQNLSTGELWFFSKHDPDKIVHTAINALLNRGNASYSFSELDTIIGVSSRVWTEPSPKALADADIENYVGSYHNDFTGPIIVGAFEGQLEVSFADGSKIQLLPVSGNEFYLPKERISITFEEMDDQRPRKMHFHENGNWSFTASSRSLQ